MTESTLHALRGPVEALAAIAATVAVGWLWLSRAPVHVEGLLKPEVAFVSLQGAWSEGRRAARVAILEYSDFQCPYCALFATGILPTLRRQYIDPGRLYFSFKHFPLAEAHPLAMSASIAAECAGAQGRFWEAHDLLFGNHADRLAAAFRTGLAKSGLDRQRFDVCVEDQSNSIESRVASDVADGEEAGITGTPTFLVGALTDDGRLHVITVMEGAHSIADFQWVIERQARELPLGMGLARK